MRRARLEILTLDAGADLQHRSLHSLGIVGSGGQRDPLVVQHVPIAARVRLDLPRRPGGQAIEGQLHVLALTGALSPVL